MKCYDGKYVYQKTTFLETNDVQYMDGGEVKSSFKQDNRIWVSWKLQYQFPFINPNQSHLITSPRHIHFKKHLVKYVEELMNSYEIVDSLLHESQ